MVDHARDPGETNGRRSVSKLAMRHLAAIAVVLLVPRALEACTCKWQSAADAYGDATDLFRGQVVDIRQAEPSSHRWARELKGWFLHSVGRHVAAHELHKRWTEGPEYGLLVTFQVTAAGRAR